MSYSEVTLGEISIDNKGSYGIAASAVEYSDDLYTYLRISDINDDGTLNKYGLKSVSDEKAKKYLLKPNDIVFARTGASTGRSYFYDGKDGKFVYAGFLIKFSINPNKANPKFMKYYTMSDEYRGWVNSFNTGSTRGNINAQAFANMNIWLPDRQQQDFIVDTLSCLDDKIELNNRINKIVEEIAQAIFKSWFVDFEPFQDGEFEDSELGWIPKGWKVGTLADIAEITSGKRPKTKCEFYSEECRIPVVGASCIMAYTEDVLFNKKILVIGRVGTHGIIQRFNEPCWPSDNTLVITSTYYEFVNQILRNIDYKSMNRGSTQPLITQTDLKNTKIIIPTKDALEDYEGILDETMQLWSEKNCQNTKLVLIRDTLLPKLMSGEIRVPIEEVQ